MGVIGNSRVESLLDNTLKTAYEQLGKLYYEKNADREIGEEYQEAFDKISRVFEEKKLLEVKMLARQGKRKCDNCLQIIPLESRFCNMCGNKLEPMAEAVLQETKVSEIKTCTKCGVRLEAGATFCTNCGARCAG